MEPEKLLEKQACHDPNLFAFLAFRLRSDAALAGEHISGSRDLPAPKAPAPSRLRVRCSRAVADPSFAVDAAASPDSLVRMPQMPRTCPGAEDRNERELLGGQN